MILDTLLFLCLSGLAGFGFSLFIIESPYIKPLVSKLESYKCRNNGLSNLKDLVVKGLRCYTCSGFWGGILFGTVSACSFASGCFIFGSFVDILLILEIGFIASAVSTTGAYAMNYFFILKDLKEKDSTDERSGGTE